MLVCNTAIDLQKDAECCIGTGSVLDAIRIGVPVIVVPNTTLLDNHQLEFAEQMAKMQYAVHGDIE
jgi:beta-1,4-N-acetylglucosaminyltransferase